MGKPKKRILKAQIMRFRIPDKKETLDGKELIIALENNQYKIEIGFPENYVFDLYHDLRRIAKKIMTEKEQTKEDLTINTDEEEDEEERYISPFKQVKRKTDFDSLYL